MKKLKVINREGVLLTDSREVAEMTNVRHADLLEKINGYVKHLTNGNFRSLDFFIESNYQDGKGETRPCFLLTRKGCDMVANKMTGEKGVQFTAAYVTQFEEMEQKLKNPFHGASKELQAIFMLDVRTQEVEARVEKLENNSTIDYGQQRELKKLGNARIVKLLGGKKAPAYRNSSLRSSAYSTLWNDYQEYFKVNSYNNTLIKDYERALQYVPRWTAPNNLLREIEAANDQLTF
ncbi:Rha family transcriptional regulator [Paenibacillus tyrfis]|uniref:Rha family transcriptional regulator n=1 Tax=Paenibacillus tyrfis TaxID=1501230 RepID=UPI00209D48FC|nr:ORF6C domain-containing protein [Paenibacillus tyrfis]MCP1306449.1 ORF6C domain-containing protein [Paenibacillus tyrfis]